MFWNDNNGRKKWESVLSVVYTRRNENKYEFEWTSLSNDQFIIWKFKQTTWKPISINKNWIKILSKSIINSLWYVCIISIYLLHIHGGCVHYIPPSYSSFHVLYIWMSIWTFEFINCKVDSRVWCILHHTPQLESILRTTWCEK